MIQNSGKLGMLGIVIGAASALAACSAAPQDGEATPEAVSETALANSGALSSLDALSATNGLTNTDGLTSVNGVVNSNGLTVVNGLTNVNGLSQLSGSAFTVIPNGGDLMNASKGRSLVKSLIACALTSSQSITRKDSSGNSYTFTGQDGVASSWLTTAANALSQDGEEAVTACVAGHIDTSGNQCSLMVTDADGTTVGSTLTAQQSATFPYYTASYFGNFFTSDGAGHTPAGFVCAGGGYVPMEVAGSKRCYANSSAGTCPAPMNQIKSTGGASGWPCAGTGSVTSGFTSITIPSGLTGYNFPTAHGTAWTHIFNVFEHTHNCVGPDGGIDD